MITARRAFDHLGITVPDLDKAVALFVDVFGFEVAFTAGPYADFGYVWPGEAEPERGGLRHANLVLGDSFNLELLEYSERANVNDGPIPRPADRGGFHLAFHVDDIYVAAEELGSWPGVQALTQVNIEDAPPMDGTRWAYFLTELGLVIELIQWEPGMSYERCTHIRMALPQWAGLQQTKSTRHQK